MSSVLPFPLAGIVKDCSTVVPSVLLLVIDPKFIREIEELSVPGDPGHRDAANLAQNAAGRVGLEHVAGVVVAEPQSVRRLGSRERRKGKRQENQDDDRSRERHDENAFGEAGIDRASIGQRIERFKRKQEPGAPLSLYDTGNR